MNKDLQEFLKDLNPKKDEQHILIYGKKYKLWRDGEYIGIATWTKDENVGDSFQITSPSKIDGYKKITVWIADSWELII